MPKVQYTASSFGKHWGPKLSGKHNLDLTWNEILWAAMTMGKPGIAYLLSHGWHSVSDLIVRSHTVYANLREVSSRVYKSSLYSGLDPTEKSGVSYFLGMMGAKILGHRLLDTPWLFHVSMIDALGGSVDLKGKSEPDLVGLRKNRDWIVAEAKGRTWGHSKSAMNKAKLQTRQVRRVNGQFPALRAAIQASFNPRLQLAIHDPDEFDEDAGDMDFDLASAMDMYYSAPMAAIEGGELRDIGGREFYARELAEIGVTIALDSEVHKQLRERSMGDGQLAAITPDLSQDIQDSGFVSFDDGLAVSVDHRWSEDRMTLDPIQRRLD